MIELKNKIEALLFSSGKKMIVQEIALLARAKPEEVKKALNELKKDYDSKESSLIIIEEDEFWKITVKEKHLELVRKIVTQTELSKTIMETLAIIAWKAPCIQSDIIKIRTNKAYDHIKELEKDGYVNRSKKGRTQLIRLAPKFYNYFDIPKEKIKEVFSRFTSLEKQIKEKEKEAEDARDKIKEIEAEHKKQRAAMEKIESIGIDIEDESELTREEELAKELQKKDELEEKKKLEKYPVEIAKDKLGDLEVVDIKEDKKRKPRLTSAQKAFREKMSLEEAEERADRELPHPLDKKVDKRVKEIVEEEKEESGKEIEESGEEVKEVEPEKDANQEIQEKVDERVNDIINPDKKE